MKQVHRIVNAVGYKRLQPITDRLHQCQYCGLTGGWHSQISDDHVPALNVRIPEQFAQQIRKVIVRACVSCNSLAGDKPHMSFEERSLWLKTKMARRNHRLLKDFDVDPSLFDQPDNEALTEREREQLILLYRLGFGLPALGYLPDDADFVLANGLRLSEQLRQFMFPGKLAEPEIPEPPPADEPDEPNEPDALLTREECIEILAAEVAARELPAFFNASDYRAWFGRNRSRANACDLPSDLSGLFNDVDGLAAEATKSAQDALLTRQEWIEILAAEVAARELPAFFNASDYRAWFGRNRSRANECDLPSDLSDLFNDIDGLAAEATKSADVHHSIYPESGLGMVEVECFDESFHCSQNEFSLLTTTCRQGLAKELRAIATTSAEGCLRASHVAKFWKWVRLHPQIFNEHGLRDTVSTLNVNETLLDQVFAVSPRPGYVTVAWCYRSILSDIRKKSPSN